jgi:predicted DNA-binding protein
MPRRDDTKIETRITRKFGERLDEHAKKAGMSRSEMVRSLVAKGINEEPTYPLAKFLVFAPEAKALYVILSPKPEGGARVHTWGVAENLYHELHNLDNLKQLVAADSDILYWEL